MSKIDISKTKELYELKELIGRGSSGRVFRAVRKADKLQVAIKLMGPDVEGGCAKHRQEYETWDRLFFVGTDCFELRCLEIFCLF